MTKFNLHIQFLISIITNSNWSFFHAFNISVQLKSFLYDGWRFFEEDFDDDFEDSFEAHFEDEFDELDIEAKFKRNIGKKISKISFQFDEELWEELLKNK